MLHQECRNILDTLQLPVAPQVEHRKKPNGVFVCRRLDDCADRGLGESTAALSA